MDRCGPRDDTGSSTPIGDNSCVTARNGICEDGSTETIFYATDANGDRLSRCTYGTDYDDCPLRYVLTYGPLTYSNVKLPAPIPQPRQPSPPPPLPPFEFTSCSSTCRLESSAYNELEQREGSVKCSDGGLNSFLLPDYLDGSDTTDVRTWKFLCDYGTQCEECGIRQNLVQLNSQETYKNGYCEDNVLGNGNLGYGTDTADCGIVPVQTRKGRPVVLRNQNRRLFFQAPSPPKTKRASPLRRELQSELLFYPKPPSPTRRWNMAALDLKDNVYHRNRPVATSNVSVGSFSSTRCTAAHATGSLAHARGSIAVKPPRTRKRALNSSNCVPV